MTVKIITDSGSDITQEEAKKLGITTPTEAGAVGAVCAFATVILYRNLSWRVTKEAS